MPLERPVLPSALIVLPGHGPVTFDVFRLFLVDVREIVLCAGLCVQQFVQLGLNGLGISVFGTLDQKRHKPGGEHSKTVPAEVVSVEEHPGHPVEQDGQKGERMSRQDAEARQRTSDHFHCECPIDHLGRKLKRSKPVESSGPP